jgi:hypothetical protein
LPKIRNPLVLYYGTKCSTPSHSYSSRSNRRQTNPPGSFDILWPYPLDPITPTHSTSRAVFSEQPLHLHSTTALQKYMRRADPIAPFAKSAKDKSDSNMASTLGSTLSMAAFLTRNKMIRCVSIGFSHYRDYIDVVILEIYTLHTLE